MNIIILDLSSDAESDSDKENQILSKDSNIVWKAGSRTVDPSTAIHSYGPRLSCQELTYLGLEDIELQYLFWFLPRKYIESVLLPATNLFASKENEKWKDVTFVEFIIFLGLKYFMEVYRLPERRMYWRTEADGALLGMCFGKYMTRNRFEGIIK